MIFYLTISLLEKVRIMLDLGASYSIDELLYHDEEYITYCYHSIFDEGTTDEIYLLTQTIPFRPRELVGSVLSSATLTTSASAHTFVYLHEKQRIASYFTEETCYLIKSTQNALKPSDEEKFRISGKARNPNKDMEIVSRDFIKSRIKLWELSKLDENWDTYGAPPIRSSCLKQAHEFLVSWYECLNKLGIKVPQPFITPISDGGIQFEWDAEGRYLELDFTPSEHSPYFYAEDESREGEPSWEGTIYNVGYKVLLNWLITGEHGKLGDLVKNRSQNNGLAGNG